MSMLSAKTWTTATYAEQYVKQLSLDFIACMNTRNFNSPGCQHISPHFEAVHDAEHHSYHATSRTDTLDFMSRFLDANPGYRTQVLDVSVNVDEAADKANAWMLRTCEGLTNCARRESVCHLEWQRQDGDWFCVGYEAIRYFPFFTIEALRGGGL